MKNPGILKYCLAFLWLLLAFLSVLIDYYTGPVYNFPFLIAIPVALASWYNGRILGIVTGILITSGELYLAAYWSHSVSALLLVLYVTVRLAIMFSFIVLVDIISRQKKKIKVLKGFLPICSFCKKIRDESGAWIVLEEYIDNHSEAKFSHSLCPECAKEHYGKFLKS